MGLSAHAPGSGNLGLILISLLSLLRATAQEEAPPTESPVAEVVAPCSLCRQGESVPLEYQSKAITVPGFAFINDCQTLESLSPAFQQNSEECNLLQSIGTICGCPIQEDACQLCEDGSSVAYGWRELDFLSGLDLFNGITPTCELVEAGLHSYTTGNKNCADAQLLLTQYCGCGAEPGSQPPLLEEDEKCHLCWNGEDVPYPDKIIDIDGFPFETCSELAEASKNLFQFKFLEDATFLVGNTCQMVRSLAVHCGCPSFHENPCPICRQEQSNVVPFPEQRLDSHLTSIFLGDMEISCGILADVAQTWSATNREHVAVCKAIQGLGTQCGCAVPEEIPCQICSDPLPQEMLAMAISDVQPYDRITCGLSVYGMIFMRDGDQLPFGSETGYIPFECRLMQHAGFLCGCNDGLFTYWGADERPKQYAAIWTQRATSILSLCGSIAIIVDVFMKRKKTSNEMYHQILLCLSFFDILSSISWGLGPLPASNFAQGLGINVTIFGDQDLAFLGSEGTDATCKAQGFLLHLGFTSVLYNMVLSYYYKLSVVNGWRDRHFTSRYRILLLGVPALIGTGVAIGAIPFITETPVACTIGSYNDRGGWLKVIGLFYIPYGPAFVYAPLNSIYIYRHFKQERRKALRWSFRTMQLSLSSRVVGRSSDCDTSSARERLKRRFSTKSKARRKPASPVESQLLWQSFWYVCAFYCSYFVFVVAFALDGFEVNAYWFYIVLSIFTPMQGFFNSIIYFRQRFIKWAGECRKRRPKRSSTQLVPAMALANKRRRDMMMNNALNSAKAFSSGGIPPNSSHVLNRSVTSEARNDPAQEVRVRNSTSVENNVSEEPLTQRSSISPLEKPARSGGIPETVEESSYNRTLAVPAPPSPPLIDTCRQEEKKEEIAFQ